MGKDIKPQPKQEQFLSSPADIVIYGGAAGGGKTYAILIEALRHVDKPEFRAVIFRRLHTQLIQDGGLLDKSREIYPLLGATVNKSALRWTFPSGATVTLDAIQYDSNVEQWQGAQIALIMFDELTHFEERTFWYMLSRNRSTSGVRPYVRATCNPEPDSFVADLIAWWIDQDTGYAIPERAGIIRWFYRLQDHTYWYDSREEAEAAHPDQAKDAPPKSFTFIPATLEDNQILVSADPGYRANLRAQGMVDQERLEKGNWKIRPAAGKVFNRAWFEIVDAAPAGGVEGRGWDFAATERKINKPDPDYTAGVLMRKVGGIYYILDMIDFQEGPVEVETRYTNICKQDAGAAGQRNIPYIVRFEQEGGSAAVRDARRLIGLLDGLDVRAVTVRGDKVLRANALAAQVKAGNVKLVKGEWNERYLRHMHAFPEGAHDDITDASSLIYNEMSEYWVPQAESGESVW